MSAFDDIPTYANRAERLPCVLVLDASSSMSGEPIAELNRALEFFSAELKEDEEARKRVRILVIVVTSSATKVVDWVDAESFEAPHLQAEGATALGAGARLALQEVRLELQRLREAGISRKKPWIWLFTDGGPNDRDWEGAARDMREAHRSGEVLVYPIAVGPADVKTLGLFEKDSHVYQIGASSFRQLFSFISASARTASTRQETSVTPLFPQIAAS